MIVYKLRDRRTGNFINKKHSSSDRLYQKKQHAASAATFIAAEEWPQSMDERWWEISKEARKDFRERMIEIVTFECVEVSP